MSETRNAVQELLRAPYGHTVWRDATGNSHVTLHLSGGRSVTVVGATFDAAVFDALDQAKATP